MNPIYRLLTRLVPAQTQPAAVLPAGTRRNSRNCVLLLDTSGSMNDTDWKPNRLAGAIDSAVAYVNRLASKDPHASVAVVQYNDFATVIVPLTPVMYLQNIRPRLETMPLGFMTNITAALNTAYRICSATGATNQVVLLSDGGHNAGPPPMRIANRLINFATIEAIGIGGSPGTVDENLMKQIASPRQDGTKRYRWIGHKEELVEHFEHLADGLSRE